MPVLSSLSLAVLLLLLFSPLPSRTQQIGSFFTAIYLNGAPLAAYQSSCGSMGQSGYCCGAGQSCAWDDSGKVACCPSGSNCQGSPYGSGVTAGAAYTTTTGCDCEATPANSVVPIAPPPMTTVTSYYAVPTSTFYPTSPSGSTTTTTVQASGQAQGGFVTTFVTAGGGGGGGGGGVESISTKGLIACTSVSTITEVNVGQPVRTVGCLIVINGASSDTGTLLAALSMTFLSLLGALIC